jgi:hypothetical protein
MAGTTFWRHLSCMTVRQARPRVSLERYPRPLTFRVANEPQVENVTEAYNSLADVPGMTLPEMAAAFDRAVHDAHAIVEAKRRGKLAEQAEADARKFEKKHLAEIAKAERAAAAAAAREATSLGNAPAPRGRALVVVPRKRAKKARAKLPKKAPPPPPPPPPQKPAAKKPRKLKNARAKIELSPVKKRRRPTVAPKKVGVVGTRMSARILATSPAIA